MNFMLDYYLETGQFDEAYSRAQPLINKQVTCYEANLRAYLKLSYYAQKAGKPEIAADMCARAEEALVGREKDEYLLLYLGLFIAYYMMTKPESCLLYTSLGSYPLKLKHPDNLQGYGFRSIHRLHY